MTQHLEMLRVIAARSSLPIVADIDTGFGNAVNVVHAVREYERAGAACVVIEDKSFPKVTSLVADGRQDVLRIEAFQGKIEAFIAAWTGAAPLVLVPTAYPEMTVQRMRATGKVGMAIWGNHTVRAAVTAIQDVYRRILAEGGIQEVDKDIVPVGEIFRLQDMDEVKDIERRFLR